ncbi:MAG: rhomboid family intramembrane serine protease [Oculatellaceae cyanobacterium Prado106]|jgi:rhomboid protease GluP|nr:rhomboid family intramembrane serine protease [Oculatellaceae cyanobacterium Prado106]
MSINLFLIQLVTVSCLSFLFLARRVPRGWVVVSGMILGVLAIAFWVIPNWAGWLAGGLWSVFVALPLGGFARVNYLVQQERFGQARGLAAYVRWLHPADGLVEYPALLRGLEMGQQGRIEEAIALFQRYQTNQTKVGQTATAMLYRLDARWGDLLSWIRGNFSEAALWNDATLTAYYLRSLGETADLNGLVQGLGRLEQKFEKTGSGATLNLGRLYAFAFCGQPEAVKLLFGGVLRMHTAQAQAFWVAIAHLALDDRLGRQQLQALAEQTDRAYQKVIAWRLAQPPLSQAEKLTLESQQILDRALKNLRQEAQYDHRLIFTRRRAYVTYLFMGLNLAVFVLSELQGGSQNIETLYRFGALVPEEVWTGEAWRLGTATVLHYGAVHLIANLLGLFFYGALVESMLGRGRFAIAYWVSGIGSMGVITLLAWVQQDLEQFCVGASGGVMGLLGVLGAVLLVRWWRERAAIAARQLQLLGFIVGMQVVSDLLTPQISLVGHVSGLAIGFLVGVGLEVGKRKGN